MHVKITPGARFMYVELTKATKQFDRKIKLWKAKRDRAQKELDKFDGEALVRMLGDRYKEIAGMRCVRLEPWGSVPRTVLPLPLVSDQRKTHTALKVEENASSRAHEDVQVNPTSATHQPPSPSRLATGTKNHIESHAKAQAPAPKSNIAAFAQELLQQRPKKKPQAPLAEPVEASAPSETKRQLDEVHTTGCVLSKLPKRSKKRVALEDACALFGM
jgi:hypothetical protein